MMMMMVVSSLFGFGGRERVQVVRECVETVAEGPCDPLVGLANNTHTHTHARCFTHLFLSDNLAAVGAVAVAEMRLP